MSHVLSATNPNSREALYWIRALANPRWSRRPPLRFDEVVLPAVVLVSQAGFAHGGGWARLSLAVSRRMIEP